MCCMTVLGSEVVVGCGAVPARAICSPMPTMVAIRTALGIMVSRVPVMPARDSRASRQPEIKL